MGLFSDDSDDGRHEWRLPQQPEGKKDPPNAKQHQSAGTQWALGCVTRAQQVGAHTFCVTNLHTRMLAQLGLLCEDVMVTPALYLPALGCSQSVIWVYHVLINKNFVQKYILL